MFEESKHPRDGDGKFASGGSDVADKTVQAVRKYSDEPDRDIGSSSIGNDKARIVQVNLDADVQKQLNAASTPKERQTIAFRYIMDNLRGKYAAEDGRTIAIEKVGADKMSHTLNETKIRVLPELARLIKMGKSEGIVEANKPDGKPHKQFTHFAYYRVVFQIGNDIFVGKLNVGIRADGSSTLYDLNPFNKQ